MSFFLWRNIFNNSGEENMNAILKGVPMFGELNRHQLKAVERILHRRRYAPGEYVFREGEIGTGMYIIESGEVSVVYGTDGAEYARLHDGEFFGELAILTESARTASAVAVKETSLLGFFQPDLFGLLETRPSIGVSVVMKIARIVAERLKLAVDENHRLSEELRAQKG